MSGSRFLINLLSVTSCDVEFWRSKKCQAGAFSAKHLAGFVVEFSEYLICVEPVFRPDGGAEVFQQSERLVSLEFAVGVLDRTVELRIIYRAVEGDDHVAFEHVPDRRRVEVSAVVALEEERRAEFAERPFQRSATSQPSGSCRSTGGSNLYFETCPAGC